MPSLEGRVAIVTGSSRGIGRAVVKELARYGAHVVVNYYQSAEAAQTLMDELKECGTHAICVQADVSQYEECSKLVDATVQEFGKVDVLVNNAGTTRDRTIHRMQPAEWQTVLDTHLNATFYMTSLVVPHMRRQRYGRIVNMASVLGHHGRVGLSNYGAAKGGMIAFTKAAALELARFGITVNALCPGFIETDMIAVIPDDQKQALIDRIPLARFGKPEEVAAFVRFLVTEGDWITGADFAIDGGMYA